MDSTWPEVGVAVGAGARRVLDFVGTAANLALFGLVNFVSILAISPMELICYVGASVGCSMAEVVDREERADGTSRHGVCMTLQQRA